MTPEEEQFVIDEFKELYTDFPSGTIASANPPLPDFLLTTQAGKKIGIEITEAVNSEEEIKYLAFRYKITDLVLEKLKNILPFRFALSIYTDNNKVIKSNEINKTVNDIVNICVEETNTIQDLELIELENFEEDICSYPPDVQGMILRKGLRDLPFGINEITLHRFDVADESWNTKSGGMVVPPFTDEIMYEIISEKEEKLLSYAKCAEYWLIIWERGFGFSYYHDVIIESPVKSKFDKVFLVRTFSHEIKVLKP
jgi:hypothetical protein